MGCSSSEQLNAYSTVLPFFSPLNRVGGVVDLSSILPDISGKQDTLVSGTNIKTINNISLLGSGNIDIQGGGGTVDQTYDPTSTNAQSGVAIAGAHFLTSSDLPTIGNGTITIQQGSSTKGTFSMNQSSGDTIYLDDGAIFESLSPSIPSTGFTPSGSYSPITSLDCIITYTEETDPETGEAVVDPETGEPSIIFGDILYMDTNEGGVYQYDGGSFTPYTDELTDPYMTVYDFSAMAGLLYRRWVTTSSSPETPAEAYYTYGELGGGTSFSTYDSSGKYAGTTEITLTSSGWGDVTVTAQLHDPSYMTSKVLYRDGRDIFTSAENSCIISNSDGTIVANMGLKQDALIAGDNISIDYSTNTISADTGTIDYLYNYSEKALSSRGAYYALSTKENILSSENAGDGVDITIEKGHNLPEGYTEYATLNCRNAYIDTGLYGSEKTRFEIYGHYQYSSSSYTNLFGDRTTSGKHMCLYNGLWRVGSQNVSSYIFYNAYGNQSDHLFIGNQYGCIYDDTKNAFSTTPSAFTTTNTLLLMGVNGSSPTVSSQTFYFRYAKIYEGDTLVFYGVPAKRNSDSAMGIYDLVSKGFFEKAGGSGSFTAGAALTPTKRIVAKGGGETVVVDSELSTSSTNPVQNRVITTELNKKIEGITSSDVTTALGYTPQTLLISGTNIKTINNESILGSGNINIQSGGTVDQTFDGTSANAQSGVAIAGKLADYVLSDSSNSIDIYSGTSIGFNAPETTDITANGLPIITSYNILSNDAYLTIGEHSNNYGIYLYDSDYVRFFYAEDGSSGLSAYSSNRQSHYAIDLLPSGISFGNEDYTTTITVPSNGSLAVNGSEVALKSDIPDISTKQDTLVSGTNIKTINNTSLLGSGNIDIQSGVSMNYNSATETLTFS